ncbi:MAG: HNH endonuclease domain-containing protein [Desulfobaccales bacterium]
MNGNYLVFVSICQALANNEKKKAKIILKKEYPYQPIQKRKRFFNEQKATIIFLRDGFIDRYSGDRLIFPPVLRLISEIMPDVFPYHTNWKLSKCHIAYWHLSPTIDHIVPITRGGNDEDNNLVTTSMVKNSAKSNWLLEELGWQLYPPGKLEEWDGLTRWFRYYLKNNPDFLNLPYIAKWHKALMQVLKENSKERE